MNTDDNHIYIKYIFYELGYGQGENKRHFLSKVEHSKAHGDRI